MSPVRDKKILSCFCEKPPTFGEVAKGRAKKFCITWGKLRRKRESYLKKFFENGKIVITEQIAVGGLLYESDSREDR